MVNVFSGNTGCCPVVLFIISIPRFKKRDVVLLNTYVKLASSLNKRYTKGGSFSVKMIYERLRGFDRAYQYRELCREMRLTTKWDFHF